MTVYAEIALYSGEILTVLGLYTCVIQYSASGIPKTRNADGFKVQTAVTMKITFY
jgi:hypothetical protein